MTNHNADDNQDFEQEQIPFFGHCKLTDNLWPDKTQTLHPVLKKIKVDYRIEDSSEDLEN